MSDNVDPPKPFLNPKLRTPILKKLHDTIRECVEADEKAAKGHDKPYGTKEFPDWKQMAEEIEGELDKRNEQHTKITW